MNKYSAEPLYKNLPPAVLNVKFGDNDRDFVKQCIDSGLKKEEIVKLLLLAHRLQYSYETVGGYHKVNESMVDLNSHTLETLLEKHKEEPNHLSKSALFNHNNPCDCYLKNARHHTCGWFDIDHSQISMHCMCNKIAQYMPFDVFCAPASKIIDFKKIEYGTQPEARFKKEEASQFDLRLSPLVGQQLANFFAYAMYLNTYYSFPGFSMSPNHTWPRLFAHATFHTTDDVNMWNRCGFKMMHTVIDQENNNTNSTS